MAPTEIDPDSMDPRYSFSTTPETRQDLEVMPYDTSMLEIADELEMMECELDRRDEVNAIRSIASQLIEQVDKDQARNGRQATLRGEKAARRKQRRSELAARSLQYKDVSIPEDDQWDKRAEKRQKRLRTIYEKRI